MSKLAQLSVLHAQGHTDKTDTNRVSRGKKGGNGYSKCGLSVGLHFINVKRLFQSGSRAQTIAVLFQLRRKVKMRLTTRARLQ